MLPETFFSMGALLQSKNETLSSKLKHQN